jgi:hypothetical protein
LNLKQERFVTGAFLFCLCLQLAHFVHTAWFFYLPQITASPAAHPAVLYAPAAYRLALPFLIGWVGRAFHIHDSAAVMAAFDLITGFIALYLLYRLTVTFSPGEQETPSNRVIRILCFLAVIQFPLAWVVPWQRPETLPSTLFLAISLFSLAHIQTDKRWFLPLMAAALCQAFIRADVPFIFGVAVFLVGLGACFKHEIRAGRQYLIAGALIAFLSAAAQAYLQFIRYPHLSYPPDTQVIQLRSNLTPHNIEIFILALLPFLLFSIVLIVKRPPLNLMDKVVVVSSILYLPLWFTVGSISEVRIYVPFLFALSMVVAKISASFLSSSSQTATRARNGSRGEFITD